MVAPAKPLPASAEQPGGRAKPLRRPGAYRNIQGHMAVGRHVLLADHRAIHPGRHFRRTPGHQMAICIARLDDR